MGDNEWQPDEVKKVSLAATRNVPCTLARSDGEVTLAIDLATEIGAAYMIQRGEVAGASYASVGYGIQRESGEWVEFDLLSDPLYHAFVRDFESGVLPEADLPLLATLSATHDAFCKMQDGGADLSGLAMSVAIRSVQLDGEDQLVSTGESDARVGEPNSLIELLTRWKKS